MAGAVDLAAVKARSDAAARAADAPAPQEGELVFAVTETNFQTTVLDRSFQVPVLLVLTSTRAPSSDALVASLTTIVNEAGGTIVLGTIDTDVEIRVAQALQARAVPAAYAVLGGQLAPGFEGTPTDEQLREFVAAIEAAAAQAGLPGADAAAATGEPPAPPEDPRFDAAEEALADGNYQLALERFHAILAEEPGNAAAELGARESELLMRIDAAGDVAADPAPDDIDGQLAAADVEFAKGNADDALRRLLDLLPRTAEGERERTRRRLIDYFELLGPDDARVAPARREMARALF
jgi:putative thioredoxin